MKLILADWENVPDHGTKDTPCKAKIFYPTENGCTLQFACPGCGQNGGITIGFGNKPDSPGWLLESGDPKDPTTWTLKPSIHCIGCCGWHGYLTNGDFDT